MKLKGNCVLELDHQRNGPVATLTINRPKRRNAIGAKLVADLSHALLELDADAGTRAIVLTGVAPGFCAGSDLKELAETDLAGMQRHEAETAAFTRSIAFLDTPVLAAVDGFALGGGFVLAISCDIVVTSPNARWHLPEVSIGWIPPWGLQTLVSRVGPVTARRITWGAETFDGREAHRLGIADAVAPEGGDVLSVAQEHAARIAALPPPAVAATKQFFAPLAGGVGEGADAWANRLFAANCGHEVAKATLGRFGVRT